jgi:hypothetical protein
MNPKPLMYIPPGSTINTTQIRENTVWTHPISMYLCAHNYLKCPAGNAPDLGEHTPQTLNALAQIRYTKDITIQITVINR